MERLGARIGVLAIAVCVVVFIIGLLIGTKDLTRSRGAPLSFLKPSTNSYPGIGGPQNCTSTGALGSDFEGVLVLFVGLAVLVRDFEFEGLDSVFQGRILRTMISGIPLISGLGTRMSDPCVYVVFWAPVLVCHIGARGGL